MTQTPTPSVLLPLYHHNHPRPLFHIPDYTQRLKMQRQLLQHPRGNPPKPQNTKSKLFPTLFLQKFQTHSHSPKTHHLALRSASTNPLQVPLSPILIIVSHTPPSPASPAELVKLSAFRINLRIFPLGA